MKKITLLLILLTMSFGYSQTLPIDFETSTTWVDFAGGVVTTIANPQSNADNNSANVGQMVKNPGEVYGGSALTLSSAMDFNANNTFSMKAYTIKANTKVLLKVENSTNGAIQYEREVTMTSTNAWETLTFDYSAIPANTYDRIVVIFDLGTVGDGTANFTYYFDDITLYDNGGQTTTVALPFNFSDPSQLMIGAECTTSLTTDAGDDVLQVVGGGALYDNAQIVFTQNVDLSDPANNTITFRVKAIAPLTSGSHLFKFESASSGDAFVEVPFTTSGTDWQTVSLDFDNSVGDNPGVYSKMVIFTDFNNNEAGTYLFDDIAGGTNVGPTPELTEQAPQPTTPNNEVLSVYSDTGGFTNIWVSDYSFGESTVVDTDDSAGVNEARKVNFAIAGYGEGTVPGSVTDITAYGYLHFDYWADANATEIRMILIEEDGAVQEYNYELSAVGQQPIVTESWVGVDVPLSYFTALGFSKDKFFQYKVGTSSDQLSDIVYFDNIYFSVNQATSLGVSEYNDLKFTVYPNPAIAEWNIQGNSSITSIEVYDVLGKLVMRTTPNALHTKLDASQLNKGIYLAKIASDSHVSTYKLIKN